MKRENLIAIGFVLVGIGFVLTGILAFNLVKKSSYLKCGGHHAIAMECLDDLKLGALIKNNGFKQDTFVSGKTIK